ncbi:MAG: hypothetical protein BWZ11_00647 [Bacteroidetes bacterium ADurb.BinA395]|jgi:hypothetical protein|nr:MAG: hypothetical protein BWZ11_00647 [Bacteroidetes bacterium ADurb.BinA395]
MLCIAFIYEYFQYMAKINNYSHIKQTQKKSFTLQRKYLILTTYDKKKKQPQTVISFQLTVVS